MVIRFSLPLDFTFNKSVVLNLPLFISYFWPRDSNRGEVKMERGKTTPLYLCCCPIGKLPGNYIGILSLSLSLCLCCVRSYTRVERIPLKAIDIFSYVPYVVERCRTVKRSISKNTLPRSSIESLFFFLNIKHHVKEKIIPLFIFSFSSTCLLVIYTTSSRLFPLSQFPMYSL